MEEQTPKIPSTTSSKINLGKRRHEEDRDDEDHPRPDGPVAARAITPENDNPGAHNETIWASLDPASTGEVEEDQPQTGPDSLVAAVAQAQASKTADHAVTVNGNPRPQVASVSSAPAAAPIPQPAPVPPLPLTKTQQAHAKAAEIEAMPGAITRAVPDRCRRCHRTGRNCIVKLSVNNGDTCSYCARNKEKCSLKEQADGRFIREHGTGPTSSTTCTQCTDQHLEAECFQPTPAQRPSYGTACSRCRMDGTPQSCSVNLKPKKRNGHFRE